jgi:hypothetical protein
MQVERVLAIKKSEVFQKVSEGVAMGQQWKPLVSNRAKSHCSKTARLTQKLTNRKRWRHSSSGNTDGLPLRVNF